MKTFNIAFLIATFLTANSVYACGASQPSDSWAGNYIGASLGGVWVRSDYNFDPGAVGSLPVFSPVAGGSFAQNSGGIYGGLLLGRNWQFNKLLLGIDSEFDVTNFSKTTTNPFSGLTGGNTTYKTTFDWLYTITPRFGIACKHFVLFGKLGAALTDIKSQLNTNTSDVGGAAVFSRSENAVGFATGVGVDYLIHHWVMGLEYNYLDFGVTPFGGQPSPASSTGSPSYMINNTFNMFKATASYKFSA